jgi:hypothetical protein
MGPFVVRPLVAALRTLPSSEAPLADARRLLESVVPLVYRPALKGALVDADSLASLAAVLGEGIDGPTCGWNKTIIRHGFIFLRALLLS